MSSLELKKINKTFVTPSGATHQAIRNLDLDLPEGQFYTLLGPSGCGKTTLLRMVAGFEQPTSGEILYRGQSLNGIPPYRRGFPMVFQSYALFPHMNVAENIAYGLKLKRMGKKEIAEKVARAVELLDLRGQEQKHPQEMSGGQQQRVALARALVMEPSIILFDEPLSNLDAKLRISMRSEIRALQKRLGITAIYVTHDQEEAMAISDRIIVLNQGRIEQQGSPMEIYQKPQSEFVARFFGCPNIVQVEPVGTGKLRILDQEYRVSEEVKSAAVIRSEAVEFRDGSGRHHAIVEDAIFLGSRFQYILRCAGPKDEVFLSVDQPWSGSEPAFSSGDSISFDLNPERLHFL